MASIDQQVSNRVTLLTWREMAAKNGHAMPQGYRHIPGTSSYETVCSCGARIVWDMTETVWYIGINQQHQEG